MVKQTTQKHQDLTPLTRPVRGVWFLLAYARMGRRSQRWFCLHPWSSCVFGVCMRQQNDLTFLRIRSKKHEIMVAPGKNEIKISFIQLIFT
jgi:hypothetical protein